MNQKRRHLCLEIGATSNHCMVGKFQLGGNTKGNGIRKLETGPRATWGGTLSLCGFVLWDFVVR